MSDDSTNDPLPPGPDDGRDTHLPRREFLRVAGVGAGVLLVGGSDAARKPVPGIVPRTSIPSATASSDVVVIGAGAWGSFTALNLVKRGAKVTLVDAYGPGNG